MNQYSKTTKKRPTEIGWDTDDDESLSRYILKGGPSKKRQRSPSYEKVDNWVYRHTREPPPACKLCSNLNSINNNNETEKDVFKHLDLSEDASPQTMRDRKWALAHGKFKVVTKVEALDLEQSPEFKAAVSLGRPSGNIRYSRVPRGYTEEELALSCRPCIAVRKTRYSFIKAIFPGSGERHHVIWTNRSGDIHMDRLVKLYDITSIQCHQIEVDCRGPKSPWFGLVDPKVTMTFDGRIHFDANMFWTSGILFKHFDTTGIESWDLQLDEMKMAETSNLFTRPPPPYRKSVPPLPPYPVFFNYPPNSIASNPLPLNPMPSFVSRPPPLPVIDQSSLLPSQPRLPYTSRPPPLEPALPIQHFVHRPEPMLTSTPLKAAICSAPPAISFAPTAPASDIPPPVLNARYTGCITEWNVGFGLIACDHIPGLVLLHQTDIINWDEQVHMPVGTSVSFSLRLDPVKGYKAFNAKLFFDKSTKDKAPPKNIRTLITCC